MKLLRVVFPAEENWLPISRLSIHPGLLDILEELGVIEVVNEQVEQNDLQRINKIMRLRDSLGINLNGAILICDLMERIAELEDEVRRLKEKRR
jgi:MerR family transcriptional regulator/heat shock protein HspR